MRTFVIVLCAAGLMIFSRTASEAARSAADAFAGGVMPALFPMMVLCHLLPVPAKAENAARTAALFGWMSGSPASAQRAARLMHSGCLRPAQLEKLLAFSGVMSPLFFTGTLAGWLGSAQAGWTMLLSHWLAAALTALLWPARPCASAPALPQAPPPSLPEAIALSARSLLAVCGAMMLFSTLSGVISGALTAAAPTWTRSHALSMAVAQAVLEIGSGAKAVIAVRPDPALLCALCSFGGVSIWLQNLLFVGESIRPARLLAMRLLHGAAGYAVCYFFLKIQNLLMT